MRMQRLFARKGQQALREQRPTLGGFERTGDARCVRRVGIRQLKAADNHRQQIVKIMRQPARELADGFHFLAVQQGFFQPLTLQPVDFHLRGFLFQEPGGVLKRGGVAGKHVERARQFAQLIAPL
ncbi:hypothetical protein D3C78_1005010 [compost metagenome]